MLLSHKASRVRELKVRAVITAANLAVEALARHLEAACTAEPRPYRYSAGAEYSPARRRARVWSRKGRQEGRSAPTHRTAKG